MSACHVVWWLHAKDQGLSRHVGRRVKMERKKMKMKTKIKKVKEAEKKWRRMNRKMELWSDRVG